MGSIMRDVFGCDCQVARFITNMTRIKRMLRMRMDQGLGARRCIPSRSRCMPVVFVALAVEAHMSRKPSPSKCHSALNTSQENCLETPDTLDILLPCHSKPVNGPISPESSLGVGCIEWSMSRPSHPLFGEHRSNGDRWPSKSAPPCGSSRKELDLHLETRARDHLPWGSPEPSQIVSASLNEREREDIARPGHSIPSENPQRRLKRWTWRPVSLQQVTVRLGLVDVSVPSSVSFLVFHHQNAEEFRCPANLAATDAAEERPERPTKTHHHDRQRLGEVRGLGERADGSHCRSKKVSSTTVVGTESSRASTSSLRGIAHAKNLARGLKHRPSKI